MTRFAQTSVRIPASKAAVTHPAVLKPAHIPQLLSFLGAIIALAVLQLACGSHGLGPQTPVPASQPTFSHVVLVVEENHSYSDVIGSSAMPYLNSVASQYGLATQYFANGHPSMPNYLMLTTGQMETFDDNFSGTINDDNVVRELVKAGKSWKAYEESIPSAGYLGGDVVPYVRRHNPFSYLSDVQNDTLQAANIVPFSQLATDLANDTLPQFSFISPDVNDDAHTGTLAAADFWLQSNIAPLIASSTFQNSGLLIITFDESEDTDVDHGGGHVASVIISSKSKMKYQSQTEYQHQSTLRLVLAASGVDSFPGLAGTAPDMTEFFTGP
jgi:phosphatidylinositol-3-phosphatase